MRGFTLVEMLIAVAVFSMALVVGVGALYSAQSINTKLQATHIIMDSVNLSLEVMTRNIRYGSSFYCASDLNDNSGNSTGSTNNCKYDPIVITSGGGKIVFKPVGSTVSDRIAYYLDSSNRLTEAYSTDGGVTFPQIKQISSDEVSITGLRFYVIGSKPSPTDTDQPMITMILSGKTKTSGGKQEASFVLQSSITSRN